MPAEVKGVLELRKALREYAPDLLKATNKEIMEAVKPIVSQARGYIPTAAPLSGWATRSFTEGKFPQYSASTIRAGIGYQTSPTKVNRAGFSSIVTIFNKSRVGAIYEVAGRRSETWNGKGSSPRSQSKNPNAGTQLVSASGELYGRKRGNDGKDKRGRLILRAFEDNQGKATAKVMKAIETADAKFKARTSMFDLKRGAA
jgi:hypothetical protein